MAEKETIYNVPLRRECLKVPRYKRTQKAVIAMREFVAKHSKTDKVKIGKYLNLKLWAHGRKNPPMKITVKVIKDKDVATVELPDAPIEEKPEEKKKGLIGKLKEKVTGKEEIKVEKPKEETEVKKKEEKAKEEVMKSAPKKESVEQAKDIKVDTPEMEEKQRQKKIVSKTEKPSHEKKK